MQNSIDVSPIEPSEMVHLSETGTQSFAPHLLIVYSLVMGVRARRIVELGIGLSTRVLRAAALRCGGTVYSCDRDQARFQHLLSQQDDHWKMRLQPSELFIDNLEAPFDFVLHDAAHDYFQVKMDLEHILPKMRAFGVICVHDTQQPDLHGEMLLALREATRNKPISLINLPFGAGLAILRVEKSLHPPIQPRAGVLPDGRPDTFLVPYVMEGAAAGEYKADHSPTRWLRWRVRKMLKGY